MTSDGASADVLELQEKSLEFMAQHQKRQRDALARVLTPEQLKIVEDEQSAELQMQRAQLRMMRAQQEAGLLDPAQGNGVGFVSQDSVTVHAVDFRLNEPARADSNSHCTHRRAYRLGGSRARGRAGEGAARRPTRSSTNTAMSVI